MSKAEKLDCADRLEAAALVIQVPGWWTNDARARRKNGTRTDPTDPAASRFGMMTTYRLCGGDNNDEGMRAVRRLVFVRHGFDYVASFTGAPGRTAREVASLMLDAADQLRGEAV